MNIYIKVLAILYFLHSQKLCTSVKHNRLSCDEVNKELIAMGVIIENIPEGTLDLSFQNVFRFHTCFFLYFYHTFQSLTETNTSNYEICYNWSREAAKVANIVPKCLKFCFVLLGLSTQDSSICSRPYSSQDCCSRAVENELLKRSAVEVNAGYRSYIAFCKKEVQNLSKNLKCK